jgi:predicted nucleic acid-binding protein
VLDDLKEQENTKIIPFSTEILDEMVKLKETHELHDEIIALTAFLCNADGVCTNDDKLVKIKNLKKIWE